MPPAQRKRPRKRRRKTKAGGRSRVRRIKRIALVLLSLALLTGLLLGVYGVTLAREIDDRLSGRRWNVPSRVFTDTTLLYTGQAITRKQLLDRLHRLGYQTVADAPQREGDLSSEGARISVYLRSVDLPFLRRAPERVRLTLTRDRLSSIVRIADGATLPLLELEPAELMQLFGEARESRRLVRVAELPESFVFAVLAAEDADFFSHPGVDLGGIARAVYVNLRRGGVAQGGSTITQQLAKNYFLDPRRTIRRKLKELAIALVLEARYDKRTILEIYLNEIYLGQRGSVAVNGVGEASSFYFGRPPHQLSIAESATLAGLIRSPNHLSPHRHPARARARRDQVLRAMQAHGWIDERALTSALGQPLETARFTPYERTAPYFVDYLTEQLGTLYGEAALSREGLAIYTTLDLGVQTAAEAALSRGLERLERARPALQRGDPGRRLQGAIVVMHPRTGHVLAMVGGRDYGTSQFNRVTQARRQPGSLYKPFVFLAGLDSLHPGVPLSNEQTTHEVDGTRWTPRNYDGSSGGQVRMREALARSLNLPTVDLAMRIGPEAVAAKARRLGLEAPAVPLPSIALGALEVQPLALARAYCAFAAGGVLPQPLSIREVLAESRAPLRRHHVTLEPRISPAEAYLITSFLRSAVTAGTASGLSARGIDFPVAGKTGTTDKARDTWFVGYTPDLLALVWIGFDDGSSVRGSGGSTALPIWADLMKRITWRHSGRWYQPPDGVVAGTVCAMSGELAVAGCPEPVEEHFLAERAPTKPCHLHHSGTPLERIIDNVRGALGLGEPAGSDT